jgi:pyruvate dehydrogenase E1 component
MAIYQARFMRYLHDRGIVNTDRRKVWAYLGDGEMDEPESLGAISLAARERLDNLVFVVNANLQRLDGPVRGNGKIIQELEAVFRGAGWNVIKVLWGSYWDPLLARDKKGLLLKRMEECVDGDYQAYKAKGGAYTRKHFFGKYPELADMVANMTDEDIWRLNRGGHDPIKVYAAFAAANRHKGQPTVILAKTVKGYGMGIAGEGMNITHSQKKMGETALKAFRDRFNIPISDDQIGAAPFYKPPADSPELKYMHERREALGGHLPARHDDAPKLSTPALDVFAPLLEGSGEKEMSTTMALVRIMTTILRDKEICGAHRPGRGPHLRHGGYVPPARHLLLRGPALRAGGCGPGDVLPRGQEGSDSAGRHQRGGGHVLLDRCGHGIRQPRPEHDPLLHLLFHVRLPADRRSGLGSRRQPCSGLHAGRDCRADHAER